MYNEMELLIFSYINSNYDIDIQNLVYKIFKYSLLQNFNIFSASPINKNIFLKENFTETNIEKISDIFTEKNFNSIEKDIQKIISNCEKENINFYSCVDKRYPKNFLKINNPPFVIFVKGKLPTDDELKNSFALVGTRKASEEGIKFTEDIAHYLSENNMYNISGLALGIDSVGHWNTLSKTGAILGQGLATKIYPTENIGLAQAILENNGFLLSELFPITPISKFNLIKRDRLQAALTSGIIIAETDIKGGTVNTFKFAKTQNKNIFVSDINKNFIDKYHKDLIVIKNSKDFEKKLNNLYKQKSLFN